MQVSLNIKMHICIFYVPTHKNKNALNITKFNTAMYHIENKYF